MAACALGGRRGSIADREEGGGARMEERTGGGGGARIPQGGGGGGTTHTPAGRRGPGGAAAGGGLAEQRPDGKHRPEGPWPLGEGTPSRRSEGERLEGEAAETASSPGIAAAGGGGRQGERRPEGELKASRPLIRVLVINDNGLWINDFI